MSSRKSKLTAAEQDDISILLSEGWSVDEVADHLGLSVSVIVERETTLRAYRELNFETEEQ